MEKWGKERSLRLLLNVMSVAFSMCVIYFPFGVVAGAVGVCLCVGLTLYVTSAHTFNSFNVSVCSARVCFCLSNRLFLSSYLISLSLSLSRFSFNASNFYSWLLKQKILALDIFLFFPPQNQKHMILLDTHEVLLVESVIKRDEREKRSRYLSLYPATTTAAAAARW